MPDNGVILAITDAMTEDTELEKSILEKSKNKNVKIFVVLSPECDGFDFYSCEGAYRVTKESGGRSFKKEEFDIKSLISAAKYEVCTKKLGNAQAI